MSQPDTELDLIRRAASGDQVAQQRFLLKNRTVLLRYIERHLPDDLQRHIEPQDVYQDVCFDAFRQINSFRATDPGMGMRWLLRIAHNRLVDIIRANHTAKRGGGRQVDIEPKDPTDESSVIQALQELAVYKRTPSQSAIRHELHVRLEQCIDHLPADYRQVIQCRYIEVVPFEETARRMNRSSSAVQMLCARALKQLRMELQSMSRYI